MIDLKNKLVVITGATSGLGACLAKDFISKGSKVISLSIVEPKDPYPEISYLDCDITNKEKVFSAVENIEKTFGAIDVFVNNAGLWMPHTPVEDQNRENIQKMLNVNLFGTMFCIQTMLPIFKKRNEGMFLNIISVRAFEGRVGSSGYGSTKAAQNGFILCLREELKETNIKVINAYPAAMKTSLFDEKKPDVFDSYMEPSNVSSQIVNFVEAEKGQDITIRN